MDTSKAISELSEFGFTITDIENLGIINDLKIYLSSYLSRKYDFDNKDCNNILNYIHDLAKIDSDNKANELILDSIKVLNKKYHFGKLILNSCPNY